MAGGRGGFSHSWQDKQIVQLASHVVHLPRLTHFSHLLGTVQTFLPASPQGHHPLPIY